MVRQFAVLLFQIAIVIGLGIAGIRTASYLNGEVSEPAARLATHTEMVWTTAPVRVNVETQNFERIPTPPDPFPLKMHADQSFRVTSNNGFVFKEQEYRLDGVETVERNKVCLDLEGRRFACGLNAFKKLENRIRGKYLECRVVGQVEQVSLVECQINGQDVRAIL
ncbi:thermonuclease family protein [Rhizobium sp. RM]|uniref:thermonuclease family protein n=1 Tax=Rhizobium/Agrobacterium group TaxID=227290 RepID=UPI00110E0F0C|nr:thermonuclease family protein [Rhizobium sp. RM]TMV21239.1 thermonuclease family protein [Rhizobium sp. Td3]